jgi:signal-transduction protein with cAMP-binding, CBS, and nucleotidyltransferase domain
MGVANAVVAAVLRSTLHRLLSGPTDLIRYRARVADGCDPAVTRAQELASTKLVWCDASATVREAAELMMEQYVRHVLLEEEGRLVGIVSARDLLGAYAMQPG